MRPLVSAGAAVPTWKVKAPDTGWPSSEVARQVTTNRPSARSSSIGARSCRALPGTRRASPTAIRCSVAFIEADPSQRRLDRLVEGQHDLGRGLRQPGLWCRRARHERGVRRSGGRRAEHDRRHDHERGEQGAPQRQPPRHRVPMAHGNSLPVRRPRRPVGTSAWVTREQVGWPVRRLSVSASSACSIRRPCRSRRPGRRSPSRPGPSRRRLEHGKRQAGAGALAEAKAEVEHRFEAEVLEGRGRAGLGGAVAGDHEARHAGHHGLGDAADRRARSRRRRRPAAARGPTDDEAGERRDLQTAELGQHVECVGRTGARERGRARRCDDSRPCGRACSSSMPVPRPVTVGAERPVNAAISAADGVVLPIPMSPVTRHAAAARHRSGGDLGADVQRGHRLGPVIAGPTARLRGARAAPCAIAAAARAARSAATPTSTTVTVAPDLAGEHVDGRAAGQEVRHHLGGDLLRPRRHALRDHAVVAGEHGHDGGRRARAEARTH